MPIRTAIIGYGRSGGTMHAGPIERLDAFEMVAVADPSPERRREAVERFGCAEYEDYAEMLGNERLDLAIVVSRNDQHSAMTCRCLKAGVNVLVTKPWALNEAEARDMMEAAERSGAQLLPWLPARWGSDFRRLKELLANHSIGEVFRVRRTVTTFARREDWAIRSKFGGGYLLNWGPHLVDPPALLMNDRVESVFGYLQQTINPGDAEDSFLAVMRLAGGAVVQVEYAVSIEPLPDWFVQGDRGAIVIQGEALRVTSGEPSQPGDPTKYKEMQTESRDVTEEKLEGPIYGDEYEIYAEVAQALRGERKFAVQPEDALEVTRLLDAIRTSSEENRIVHL